MSGIRPIDRFVGALHRDQGSELVFESGRSVRVKTATGERTILAQEVRTDQIENLVREVIPPDCARIFEDAGEVSFPYTSPTGAVMIHLLRRDKKLLVTVRPYAAAQQRRPALTARPSPAMTARPAVEQPMVMESALESVMGAARPVVTGMPAGRGAPLGRIAPVVPPPAPATSGPRPAARAGSSTDIQAALEAYVETVESAPMELRLESFAPPPETVAKAEQDIARRAAAGGWRSGDRVQEAIRFAPPPPHGAHAAAVVPPAAVVPVAPPPSVVLAVISSVPSASATTSTSATPARIGNAVAVATAQPEAPPPPPPVRLVYSNPPASGPRKIDAILRTLVKEKGSDLHLTAKLLPMMRKDGDIGGVPGFGELLSSETIHEWLMEIAPASSREKFTAKNDADYAYEIPGVARFRVNVFRDRRGVGGVLRVIPSQILTAEQLKLPPVVRDLCHLEKGLVVVTGPTGSGKSTTLAAMVDLINKTRADHVITIEDPVEFVHEPQKCLVNQREIHSHTESFSAALRAALREDPDIVLVGEMRDLETVSIAIETAETGHLVFGTLHTNTAVSTVDRIIDQFPTDRQAQVRVMLSESLKGVVAQTLCKKIGGGRVAALEILIGVPAVANMIREGKTFQVPSIMQTGKNVGMVMLNDSLLGLVKEGLIEPKEAFRRAVARAEMKSQLERAGYKVTE